MYAVRYIHVGAEPFLLSAGTAPLERIFNKTVTLSLLKRLSIMQIY